MGKVAKTRLDEVDGWITRLERSLGATSDYVGHVICGDDGFVPAYARSPHQRVDPELVFAIQAVPSGKFLVDASQTIASPVLPYYRNIARGRWYFRKVGITMCRQYREESTPPEMWIGPYVDLPACMDAPAMPDTTVERTASDFAPVVIDAKKLEPPIDDWAVEARERKAAALEKAGVRFVTSEESGAIYAKSRISTDPVGGTGLPPGVPQPLPMPIARAPTTARLQEGPLRLIPH